jgi:hypothetical protein
MDEPSHTLYERAAGARAQLQISTIDVLDRVLDKGIVIDAWVRMSLAGIDLMSMEARVVVASIDTYVRFSEVALGPTLFSPPAQVAQRPKRRERKWVVRRVEPFDPPEDP